MYPQRHMCLRSLAGVSISYAIPTHTFRFVGIAPCVDAKGHARDDDNSDRCKEASSHSR